MLKRLPDEFKIKMKKLLLDEYDEFIAAYERDNRQSLRVNLLKGGIEEFLEKTSFHLTQVPWIEEGFYYTAEDAPGKHPYHSAGVYYIQEPSAMTVVSLLGIEPGDRVLDLCAAPGGKSTFAASCLQGEGVLVSNEIVQKRSRILLHNIERMGVKNALITNEDSFKLAEYFPEFFNKIVVDAPCSGEGMFRKDPDCCDEWSPKSVERCSERQEEILENAYRMLLPGGKLVYSTCTFSPEENEMAIDRFMAKHVDMKILRPTFYAGFSEGHPEWSGSGREELRDTVRLWPHRMEGEGHYIALLQKDGTPDKRSEGTAKSNLDRKQEEELKKFMEDTLRLSYQEFLQKGTFQVYGESLYLVPKALEGRSLKGLSIVRNGLHMGEFKKNRFEPSHHLALALKPHEVKNLWDLRSSERELERYLAGEALEVLDSLDGWTLVAVDGYSLGWGKSKNGTLKNHYPKGLRVSIRLKERVEKI